MVHKVVNKVGWLIKQTFLTTGAIMMTVPKTRGKGSKSCRDDPVLMRNTPGSVQKEAFRRMANNG